MDTPVFVGIDPGKSGALVILMAVGGNGPPILDIRDTPVLPGAKGEEYDTHAMAALLREVPQQAQVLIERVHAMPDQGVRSMFNMGYGLGLWIGALSALQLSFELVSPERWKREVMADCVISNVKGRNQRQRALKVAAVQQAQRLFPVYAKQFTGPRGGLLDGRAEATLLAEWGRRRARSQVTNGKLDEFLISSQKKLG